MTTNMNSKFGLPWKKDPRLLHEIYLKADVLLLANVLKTFRNTCFKNYKLDPAHFYIAPGLA